MKDIAIFGAGGFGREIACLIQAINNTNPTWNLIGFFDDGIKKYSTNEFGPILGGMSEINNYNEELSLVIAIGNPKMLSAVSSKINNNKIDFPNIIAPGTLLFDSKSLEMGIGNIISFKSVISCNISIGNFNLLNCGTLIGHDTSIGSFNVFNPYVKISGDVKISNSNLFGVNSVVLQQLTIGDNIILGANSTLMRKPKNDNTYLGTPAKLFNY